MEMDGNLIKARPCALSIIRKEYYLLISIYVLKYGGRRKFFLRNEINYNLNLSLIMSDNCRDNQRRSLKLPEIPTTDQPDKDQLRA